MFTSSANQCSNGIHLCKFLVENVSPVKFYGKPWCNIVFVLTFVVLLEMWHYSGHFNMRISIIYTGIEK